MGLQVEERSLALDRWKTIANTFRLCDQYRNVFPSAQQHFLLTTNILARIIAIDPKLGEKKWPLQKGRSVHTRFVRA
jgi:hypothetical protein